LPEEGLVFCCFNQTYKIEAAMFSRWMAVLEALPGSSLWLLDGGPGCRDSLGAAARAAGIDPGRLLFAPRIAQAAHLPRRAVAATWPSIPSPATATPRPRTRSGPVCRC
jgi:predicted O-linked N-acetylglucosamine transferase (SPINDLY family)